MPRKPKPSPFPETLTVINRIDADEEWLDCNPELKDHDGEEVAIYRLESVARISVKTELK